ncbi:MAG TPA: GNAT family N-acetyltransferase [Acidimicrobiales bacterium]|nr:GNAT family N-acetyltransferase [Acidimicrobiales bacterium]
MELARPAQAADRQTCTRLLSQALVAVAAMRGGAALLGDATPATLLERWSGTGGTILVGEYEGAVVGLAAATAREVAGERRGLVECCYVESAARGVGVGSALLAAAVAWCEAWGCGEVDALALPGDRATKQRLEAAGFAARLLTLSRRSD